MHQIIPKWGAVKMNLKSCLFFYGPHNWVRLQATKRRISTANWIDTNRCEVRRVEKRGSYQSSPVESIEADN